jgi:glycosyltransferase involved in cell wall biosynthesis
LVDAGFAVGGAPRLAVELAIRLDPDRFERVFCVSRPIWGEGVEDRLRAAGVRTLTLRRASRAHMLAWRPLISLLRRERTDILHCHMFGSNVSGAILGRLLGVPVVIAHEHSGSFDGSRVQRLLERQLVGRYADAFLTVSKEARRQLLDVQNLDPRIVRVLPNGIPPLPQPSHRDLRHELGFAPGRPVVGTVTVLRPEKALDIFIRSVPLVAQEFPTLKVLIVGGGPEETSLRALVDDLGLSETVMFTGFRSDIADVLAIFDVAVLSSDYEGTPLSVMEYMAAGRPIVATGVGGVRDLVTHGVHGLLVQPRDPKALAGALVRLLRDPAMRAQMGEAGRTRQQREFTIDVTLDHLELLYEQLFYASGRTRRECSRSLQQVA